MAPILAANWKRRVTSIFGRPLRTIMDGYPRAPIRVILRAIACTLGMTSGIATAIAAPPVTAEEFARQAYVRLPIEPPYAFHQRLSEGMDPASRDTLARPSDDELAVADTGWEIHIAERSGEAIRSAVDNLIAFLRGAMRVRVGLRVHPSLAALQGTAQAIIIGTVADFPGMGAGLSGTKDYRLTGSDTGLLICGYDERGAMHGVYNLEARFRLREAPFFPRKLDVTRVSSSKCRMTLSGLGWDEWPDAYLQMLSRYGFDAIFASAYANPDGTEVVPYFGTNKGSELKTQDPEKIRSLIRRAARYGIDLYCPILYGYTGEPENISGLKDLIRRTVHQFPEIRGYILLSEGFYYKTFNFRGPRGNVDIKEMILKWQEAVRIVQQEAQAINPRIEILPWDYNLPPREFELKEFAAEHLPIETTPLVTFENGTTFQLDGVNAAVRDYSISRTGPSEAARRQIAVAKRRGMRGVYAKADAWASWQFGTFPYIPVPQQWQARTEALRSLGVDGTLESWSYGFKPNFVAELRAWASWSNAPRFEDLLAAIARREFGAGQEALVLEAWERFSEAIRLVPETGPSWGTVSAVGSPLFFEQGRTRMNTRDHSWIRRQGRINPYWPFTRYILFPDFTNQTNVAEKHASPFKLPTFLKYQALAADKFEEGLKSYRRAALLAPVAKQPLAFTEVLLVEQMQRMLRSAHAILSFEDLRLQLAKTEDRKKKISCLDRMSTLLEEELVRTRHSYETARRDSRLGYEWEEDYLCSVDMIREKLILLEETLREQIPAYRQAHHLNDR